MLYPSAYYHIYNRANGDDNLFKSDDNFNYFIRKYRQHISPIADTFAYCLMPNHFHFFVRIKGEKEIVEIIEKITPNYKTKKTFLKFQTLEKFIPYFISKQFSNLFSSYTQAFNKQQKRIGSLFQKNFKHKEVQGLTYFQDLVTYIHCNAVHHGFADSHIDWTQSSYHSIISNTETFINREDVISWFGDRNNFMYVHEEKSFSKNPNLYLEV